MITSAITVLRPTAPGVAPGTALPAGPAGPSAYQQAGGDAVWGSLAKWLASLAAPQPTQAQVTAAVQGLLGQPGGIAKQDDLSAEILRAEAAETLAFPAASAGNAAKLNVGTTAGTVAAGNDSRIVGAAPLNSPGLTGTPTAPTPGVNDASTSIATTQAIRDRFMQSVGLSLMDFYQATDADLSAALQRAHDAAGAGTAIRLPPKVNMPIGAAQVTISKPLRFIGLGFGDAAGGGTSFRRSSTASPPILLRPGAAGTRFEGFEVNEVQPAPAPGWAPSAYPQFFDILNLGGGIDFTDVMFRGVNKGISNVNSGRLSLNRIKSQVFGYLAQCDQDFDSDRFIGIHNWPYWADNGYVHVYSRTNADVLRWLRADTPYAAQLFGIFVRSIVYLGKGTSSGASDTLVSSTRGKIADIQSDESQYLVLVDTGADYADLSIGLADHQGVDINNAPNTQAGSTGIMIRANGVRARVSTHRSEYTDGVVKITGNNCTVDIDTCEMDSWGASTANAAAFDTSAGTGNVIRLAKAPRTYSYLSRVLANGNGISLGPSGANLLDNGDFRVNQRSYATGGALSPGQYAHDRWLWGVAAASYTFAANGDGSAVVTLPPQGGIQQRVHPSLVVGGDYTLSGVGSTYGRIDYAPPGGSTVTGAFVPLPFTVNAIPAGSAVTVWMFNPNPPGGSTTTGSRWKLELGDVATPFQPRSLTAELRACRDFYRVSTVTMTCTGTLDVMFDAPMVGKPAIGISQASGGSVAVSSGSYVAADGFRVTSSGSSDFSYTASADL